MALDERNFGGLRFAAIYTVGRSSVFAGTPSARFLLAREWCEGEVRCRELPGPRDVCSGKPLGLDIDVSTSGSVQDTFGRGDECCRHLYML